MLKKVKKSFWNRPLDQILSKKLMGSSLARPPLSHQVYRKSVQ